MHRTLFGIALLGLVISSYLWIARISPIPLVCTDNGGCHTVQASRYAAHFGIPTAFYGILFYLALSMLAIFHNRGRTPHWMMILLYLTTGIGFAVSAYLTYLEAFVIKAWCAWCVVSAILTTLAFAIVWLQPKRDAAIN